MLAFAHRVWLGRGATSPAFALAALAFAGTGYTGCDRESRDERLATSRLAANTTATRGAALVPSTAPDSGRPFVVPFDTTTTKAEPGIALPRLAIDVPPPPSGGRTVRARDSRELKQAIERAVAGDVILLQPRATYVGPFYLRKRAAPGWITIRSGASDSVLPRPGERMTPAFSPHLPRLVTRNAAEGVFYVDQGATGWRLTALEVTADSSVRTLTALVRLGTAAERSADELPSAIILDRLYVHGLSSLDLQRCVMLNSGAAAVVDSYIGECSSRNYDSQAIGGWSGPGPYRITNNFLEGTGENVMFGGADPRIEGLVPSDIEIRGNHFLKPIRWKGTGRVIKNLFELKNAQRVLFEANVLDGSWKEGQAGAAINLKSENAGRAPWSVTRDVTIRYNRVRNVGAGLALAGIGSGSGPLNERTKRIAIVDNVFDRINIDPYNGDGYLFLATGGMEDIVFNHNTMSTTGHITMLGGLDGTPAVNRFTFRCNIVVSGDHGVKGSGAAAGTATLRRFAPGYSFQGNIIIGGSGDYPPGNTFVQSIGNVGFTSPATGDFRLMGGTDFKGRCTRGRDPGADAARVTNLTSRVVLR